MSRRPLDSAGSAAGREEKDLVERMLDGDEDAMEEFADGYFPGLYRFALRRLGGDAELAREIVQTTVCKALAKLASYGGRAPLFTWLCACCRNEIGMHFRRKRSRKVLEFVEGATERALVPNPGHPEAPEERLVRREEADLVHRTLDLLPPHYARALEWKYVERLSVRDIATRLGCSPKAAESLLSRARQAFRESWEGFDLDPGVGSGEARRESGVHAWTS